MARHFKRVQTVAFGIYRPIGPGFGSLW